MFEKGTRAPDYAVTDFDGRVHTLGSFRRKSHVVLVYGPDAPREAVERWIDGAAARQDVWTWLKAKVIVASHVEGAEPGVYVIDRWGTVIERYSIDDFSYDAIERDYVYHEARHC